MMQVKEEDEELRVVLVNERWMSPSKNAGCRSLTGRRDSQSYGEHDYHAGADNHEGQSENA